RPGLAHSWTSPSAIKWVGSTAAADLQHLQPDRCPPRSRPLPQPHTSAAAVLVYELDAPVFECSAYFGSGVGPSSNWAISGLQSFDGWRGNPRCFCQFLLRPRQQGTRSLYLTN